MGSFKATKKPVTIEAIQFVGYNWKECVQFMSPNSLVFDDSVSTLETLEIKTLEGTMIANVNDFIIKGLNGEFYPCKPDIFFKTYDLNWLVQTPRKLSTIQKRYKLNSVFSETEIKNNAYHVYRVYGALAEEGNPRKETQGEFICEIRFQNGARMEENSVHGVLDVDLLEIVRDRLIAFQNSPFACRENALALTKIEEALLLMNWRVEERAERKVLGTNKV